MNCPICQRDNPDENRFCWNCGTRLKAVPPTGALGPAKGRDSVVLPLDEERARERRRLDTGRRRILIRGIVVGALVAGAIGAFVGTLTGFASAPMSASAARVGFTAYLILSGLTSALQGAVAGAIVGGTVAAVGGGSENGWRAGALVNAVAFTAVFILSATGWGDWIVLIGAGGVLWTYLMGLMISALWGGIYGWLIGTFVESSFDRW